MKYLWSPWRMKYILQPKRVKTCIFCKAGEEDGSPENLVITHGERAFVILNRYPYTSGHLMVVPYQHTNSFEALEPETRAELFELMSRSMSVLRTVYRPEGFNLGANVGEVAGAGIAEHVHFHVVPRWGGDTNFMSSVGETRVLPESLEETFERVKLAWSGLPQSPE